MARKAKHPYASRKLVAATFTAGAIMGMGLLAAFMPALAPSLPTIVGGLVACLVSYLGGNVAATVVVGKAEAATATVDAPDKE